MKTQSLLFAALLVAAAGLAGCQKEEGPMEKMGKKIDHAAEEVKDSGHDMSDDIKDAARDAEKAVKDAAEEVEKAVEGDG